MIHSSKSITSHSQNYQDAFALLCSDYKRHGTFLDIGCSTPEHCSNVVTLIGQGWTGLGFDLKHNLKEAWKAYDKNITVAQVDVIGGIGRINEALVSMPAVIDYLNIDVDGYPCQYAIENLDHTNHVFRCITIEHDAYRFGNEFRDAQRKCLLDKGYEIAVTTAAEDWYVHSVDVSEDALMVLAEIPEHHMITDANVHDIRTFLKFEGIHDGPYKTDLDNQMTSKFKVL